jgi:hypothetical protein
MKRERNIFMIKHSRLFKDLKDSILNWIEKTSGLIYNWAWDQRWNKSNRDEWIKGYKEWKKH